MSETWTMQIVVVRRNHMQITSLGNKLKANDYFSNINIYLCDWCRILFIAYVMHNWKQEMLLDECYLAKVAIQIISIQLVSVGFLESIIICL